MLGMVKIIQHRMAVLAGVLVIAVVLAVLQQGKSLLVAEVCTALLPILMLGLFVASLIAVNARHPAMFQVRHGTFTTPPDASTVLSAAAITVLPVADIGLTAVEVRAGFGLRFDRFDIVSLVLLVVLLALLWYRVLGPFGPSLRPDGLLDRQPFGSVFVPWQAGLAAEPTTRGVKLRFARPELVERRGFRPGTSIRTGADPGFTAWAINLYALRPDLRPAIGTHEGLLQLKSR
jgi:hypothetical protein